MKKISLFLFIIAPLVVWGQDEPTFQSDFAGNIAYNSGHILSLLDAIPQDKCSWSPAEGVRTVSQAFMHIAAANYFFSSLVGAEIPEGVDPMSMETITDKTIMKETLEKSFQFLTETAQSVDDSEMNDMINFPPAGMDLSRRSFLFVAMAHVSEHKGQLVAYARANGVTPPWSE